MPRYAFTFEGKQCLEPDPRRLDELWSIAEASGRPDDLRVLEWGSGLSTLLLADAVNRRANGYLTTIDHAGAYQQAVLAAVPDVQRAWVQAITVELQGAYHSADKARNYATYPLGLVGAWDLIVIDGRRRVECALVAAMVSGSETRVALHDFRRVRYTPISKLYDVLGDGLHYRVMRAKPALLGRDT